MKSYLQRYPLGVHKTEAFDIEEYFFWHDLCLYYNNAKYYKDYLEKYPEGKHIKEAKERYTQLLEKEESEEKAKVSMKRKLQYLAVSIDVVIAISCGLIVNNTNVIYAEENRSIFTVICFILCLFAWVYPIFETDIKIDNEGCFEQGCIHPIIGVFGILFFPIFIHYWLYKGIERCLEKTRR